MNGWKFSVKDIPYFTKRIAISLYNISLKRLCCNHEYIHIRNIYGDEINYVNGKRSEWFCEKCGKRKLEDELFSQKLRSKTSPLIGEIKVGYLKKG